MCQSKRGGQSQSLGPTEPQGSLVAVWGTAAARGHLAAVSSQPSGKPFSRCHILKRSTFIFLWGGETLEMVTEKPYNIAGKLFLRCVCMHIPHQNLEVLFYHVKIPQLYFCTFTAKLCHIYPVFFSPPSAPVTNLSNLRSTEQVRVVISKSPSMSCILGRRLQRMTLSAAELSVSHTGRYNQPHDMIKLALYQSPS